MPATDYLGGQFRKKPRGITPGEIQAQWPGYSGMPTGDGDGDDGGGDDGDGSDGDGSDG